MHDRIDHELAEALAQMPGSLDLSDLKGAREILQAIGEQMAASAPAFPGISVEEITAPVAGAPDVPVRILRPRGEKPLPVILWFHGGGQILGTAAQDDPYLMPLVDQIGAAIVAVDYRLAPEHPAPAAAEDGLHAYQWLLDNAEALGFDSDRIAIAGASGGAGIAAATALMIRDAELPQPLFQMLLYPMIDDRNITQSSHEISDLGVWDRANNILAWDYILGAGHATEDISPYRAPARAKDLSGLPPTYLAVGELDVFRDEDLDYALRLQQAGVAVELHLFPGAYHAFDLFAPATEHAKAFTQSWYKSAAYRFAAPTKTR
ncbi:alpha/beta hydrolase fold domain-containing protein [Streptomyces sp. NPDC001414]